jgi:hypothetical protein
LVVDLDLHDVLVLGHRPIGAVEALPAVMYRGLAPQPGEIRVVRTEYPIRAGVRGGIG